MTAATQKSETYGLLAEFKDPETLVRAAQELHNRGFRRMEAYSPYPIEGLALAIGFRRTRLPLVVLIGALIGASGGYLLQYWVSVIAYPLSIGGRPLHSWPSFLPVTFETTILCAALFAVLGMLGLNGLPRPHHPLFAADRFEHASSDGYFLCVETRDPQYDEEKIREALQPFSTMAIQLVPAVG